MITVIINSHNNAGLIADCIQSAHLLTDLIILVDMQSTDDTVSLAESCGAIVRSVPPARYVEPARLAAIQQAPTPWVFVLDTDERITPELAAEIKEKISNFIPPTKGPNKIQESISQDQLLKTKNSKLKTELSAPTYFRVPRRNIFGQKWLRHGGWWPDAQIRLIQKSALRDWPARIHSTPIIDGTCATLKHPILHYFHSDLTTMVAKTTVFEDIESDLLYQAGRPVSVLTFPRKFMGELFRRLIQRQGYRDGVAGWIESLYQAYSKTITYLYLYEKKYITKP